MIRGGQRGCSNPSPVRQQRAERHLRPRAVMGDDLGSGDAADACGFGQTAALAAGLILLRQGAVRPLPETATVEEVPPGEELPGQIRLERLRELGI